MTLLAVYRASIPAADSGARDLARSESTSRSKYNCRDEIKGQCSEAGPLHRTSVTCERVHHPHTLVLI